LWFLIASPLCWRTWRSTEWMWCDWCEWNAAWLRITLRLQKLFKLNFLSPFPFVTSVDRKREIVFKLRAKQKLFNFLIKAERRKRKKNQVNAIINVRSFLHQSSSEFKYLWYISCVKRRRSIIVNIPLIGLINKQRQRNVLKNY